MGLGSFSLPSRNTSSSSSGSSALQKALERNRKKMQKRSSGMSSSSSTTSRSASAVRPSSLRSQLNSGGSSLRSKLTSSRASGVTTTRKSVANGDNVSFTTPLRKTTSKSPSVSYRSGTGSRTTRTTRSKLATTKKRTTRKSIPLREENLFIRSGVFLGWLFCGVLFLRLIFAERGVVDYYQKNSLINYKIQKQKNLVQENKELEEEIFKLEGNQSYQKKMARKHLGVIARDEFLVLFAREVGGSTGVSYRP